MSFLKKNYFILIVILMLLIKQRLATMLPLRLIYDAGGCDDLLMVQIADSLFRGKWPKLSFYLVKGWGFPFFLILSALTGIGYAALNALFHSLSCILVVYALKPLSKKQWESLIFLFFLLFSPITLGSVFQRVYRSSITLWQVQMIVASLAAMLLRINASKKQLFLWSLPGIVSLSWFYHTREDAMWIIPFAVGMLIVSICFLIWNKIPLKEAMTRISILSLPLILLLLSTETISAINYYRNGFWGTTYFNSKCFSNMVRTVYSIDFPDSQTLPPRLTISRNDIRKLYEFSPTMAKNKKIIESHLDNWSNGYKDPKFPQEVWNGWIFWAMREWTDKPKAKDANKFYENVSEELHAAIQNGALKTRPVMPFSLMAPWKPQAWPDFKDALWKSLKKTLCWSPDMVDDGRAAADNMTGFRYMSFWIGSLSRHVSDCPSSIHKIEDFAVKICDLWTKIYQYLIIPIEIAGGIGFVILLVSSCIHPTERLLQVLFILCGLAASYLLLILGISYTDATGFFAVDNLYLCGAYPLILIFFIPALLFSKRFILDVWKNRSGKSVGNSNDIQRFSK